MTTTTRQVRFLLIGVGNVGRRFLELLVRKRDTLRDRLGLELTLVGVADTSGDSSPPRSRSARTNPVVSPLVSEKA